MTGTLDRTAGDEPGSVATPSPGDAMMLAGIPASVRSETVLNFFDLLGIDYQRIPRRDGVVEIGDKSIEVTIRAQHANGQPYLNHRNEIAEHRISIPIIWPKEEH